MLTRDQIKEALAQTDEKFKTPEIKREAVIDFIENTQLKAKHEGESARQERRLGDFWYKLEPVLEGSRKTLVRARIADFALGKSQVRRFGRNTRRVYPRVFRGKSSC